MWKCDFNKWVLFRNFAVYFQSTFLQEQRWGAAPNDCTSVSAVICILGRYWLVSVILTFRKPFILTDVKIMNELMNETRRTVKSLFYFFIYQTYIRISIENNSNIQKMKKLDSIHCK